MDTIKALQQQHAQYDTIKALQQPHAKDYAINSDTATAVNKMH